MYNDALENLITLALIDGELTIKEREILCKKATDSGIDLDEFEMVLDARLFEKQQTKIHEQILSKINQPSEKINSENNSYSISTLIEKLKSIEIEEKNESLSINGLLGSFFKRDQNSTYSKLIEKKKSIISEFPLPNSKSQILDFLKVASLHTEKKGNFAKGDPVEIKSYNDLVSTWHSKCDQLIKQSIVIFKNDDEAMEKLNFYAKFLKIKLS
jgi:hypothetical protein